MSGVIGQGVYNAGGQKNAGFLQADNVGPFPAAMQGALQYARLEAAHNHGLTVASSPEEWGSLGPLAGPTPTAARNKKSTKRKKDKTTNAAERSVVWTGNTKDNQTTEQRLFN
jgi:hypothetical protein